MYMQIFWIIYSKFVYFQCDSESGDEHVSTYCELYVFCHSYLRPL